jgi:hypothetical protein
MLGSNVLASDWGTLEDYVRAEQTVGARLHKQFADAGEDLDPNR